MIITTPTWTTHDEIDFLNSIQASVQASNLHTKPPTHVLIARYLDAAERRVDWHKIDRATVTQHCAYILKTLGIDPESIESITGIPRSLHVAPERPRSKQVDTTPS